MFCRSLFVLFVCSVNNTDLSDIAEILFWVVLHTNNQYPKRFWNWFSMSNVYFVFSAAVVVLHFSLGASFVQSSDRDRMKTPKTIGFNLSFFSTSVWNWLHLLVWQCKTTHCPCISGFSSTEHWCHALTVQNPLTLITSTTSGTNESPSSTHTTKTKTPCQISDNT